MCELNPEKRIESFENVKRQLQVNEMLDDLFSENEIEIYQAFATELSCIIPSVYSDIKYEDDSEIIQKNLSDLYRNVMLEEYIPINTAIIQCFLNGAYRYSTKRKFKVKELKDFLVFFKSCSKEKKNIILSNLHSRFDAINRIEEKLINEDEIPF